LSCFAHTFPSLSSGVCFHPQRRKFSGCSRKSLCSAGALISLKHSTPRHSTPGPRSSRECRSGCPGMWLIGECIKHQPTGSRRS
uniref:Uncharacterized protein n=1 Tax=Mastacembelus armatus TaxID=205130 RepID=A0A3Q3NDL5_9TELE